MRCAAIATGLALLVGALAAVWIAAICLILIQL